MGFKLYNSKSRYSRNYFSKGLISRFHRNGLKRIWKMINKDKYNVIGDFGCGDGVFIPCLLQLGSVYAIDRNKKYLDLIKINHDDLKLVNQDLKSLDFDKGFFDLIVCLETLEHSKNYQDVIKEIKRTLNKNGKGIVSVPIESGFSFLIKYLFRLFFRSVKGYSFSYVWNSFIGRLDKVNHEDHKGFDYNLIVKEIKKNFNSVKICYVPRFFSMRVIIEFMK